MGKRRSILRNRAAAPMAFTRLPSNMTLGQEAALQFHIIDRAMERLAEIQILAAGGPVELPLSRLKLLAGTDGSLLFKGGRDHA